LLENLQVATGEVDMAIGGDQGGSIPMPSCWSGCVGLKATFGLVPVTGSLGRIEKYNNKNLYFKDRMDKSNSNSKSNMYQQLLCHYISGSSC